MNIVELYQETPVEGHGKIRAVGNRVLVTSNDGTDEYLMDTSGDLCLVHSDRDLRQDIAAIKEKLGI